MHAFRVYWVALSLWLSIPLVVVNVDTGFAGEGFYDDFSDKNYADGDPQTWSSSVLYPNTNLDRVAPGRYLPGAPTEPYVPALRHTVPQIMASLRD